MVKRIELTKLTPHPDNRPLGINEEKVEQIAAIMSQSGYDESKPLKARPFGDGFQIIEGEHRFRAAKVVGLNAIPVYVQDMTDEEALIELVAGNAQTESHALDYGYAALKLCEKDSKKGLGYSEFGKRVGMPRQTISRAVKAAQVRSYVSQCPHVGTLLDSVHVLEEIGRCKQEDWVWFHELAVKKELSVRDCIEISKRIRTIDKTTSEHTASIFDLTEQKQRFILEKERKFNQLISLFEGIEECANNLKGKHTLHTYSVTDNEIQQVQYDAQSDYIATLKGLKTIDRPAVFKQYQQIRSKIKSQTREQAEKDQAYYKNETNRKEAEEQARIEWEQFMPKNGQWYEVGPHRLYCGDNTDKAFINGLPDQAKFAFADPPYNEDVDEWDSGFVWGQDYLADIADFVVVTPGISAIFDFARLTNMPYKWSLSAWISNGMTRGALGFGNWIYGALFSKKESVHLTAQDFKKINIQTSGNADHYHKGKKPDEYMDWLLSTFCEEGDKVIDPFLGSGTTLLRADAKGLFCFGAEKKPEYCKKIIAQYKNTLNA